MPKWHHTVKLLFANSVHHFSLLKMCHGWSKHFTSRYDPSTPHPPPNIPQTQQPRATACREGRQVTAVDRKGLSRRPERNGAGATCVSGSRFTFYTLPRSLTGLRQSSLQFRKAEKSLVAMEANPRGRKSTWEKIRAQTVICAKKSAPRRGTGTGPGCHHHSTANEERVRARRFRSSSDQ